VLVADQACSFPVTTADAHLDARYRSGPRPRNAPHGQHSLLDFAVGFRLGDQRPHALQGHRLPDHLPVAPPLVEIPVDLKKAGEWRADGLDLG
jgi:hypothetical protein